MGHIASALAMTKLIEKAKNSVVATAVIRNSNHFRYGRLLLSHGGRSGTNWDF
jgi:Malate/L-lactate dehydrogenases